MKRDNYPKLTQIENCLDGYRQLNIRDYVYSDLDNSVEFYIDDYQDLFRACFIPDDLMNYAEELMPHITKAMNYAEKENWSDDERKAVYLHAQIVHCIFAFLLLEFDRKKFDINVLDYTSKAGIKNYSSFASAVYLASKHGLAYFLYIKRLEELLARPLHIRPGELTHDMRQKLSILNNETVIYYLRKMQHAGLLDENYQWINKEDNGRKVHITLYKKAAYAYYIGCKAKLDRSWCSAFSGLWKEISSRQLSRGLSESNGRDFTPELERVFG